jgi:asparagine synthase (glutamine-hydrolysing)
MCGIVGLLTPDRRAGGDALSASLALLAHRGPDGEGTWCRSAAGPPFVTFGHRRLAIIDRSDAGAQPMVRDGGRLAVTCNGEIYNYRELRAELEARGRRFRSATDTEVLLHAYDEWGAGCLERLNGMFAFAIWDERRQELFAARDRFGEKPFHYVWDPRARVFAFASEIKALLAVSGVAAALDERALYRFVAFGEQAGAKQSLWQGVRRLPHAHALTLRWRGDAADLRIDRYWDIDLDREDAMPTARAATRFAELFADSVRLRLRADVAVGTSLSGGLDSSAVVCQIHALGAAGGQKTFSARMEEPSLDEGDYIAAVVERTGVEAHEVWPSAAELRERFGRVCHHLEEPFPSTSPFAQHLVMRLASEHDVTVLLDGQGADELLAGYRPYFTARYADLAARWRLARLWEESRAFRARHARPFPLSGRAVAARLAPGLHRAWRSFDGRVTDDSKSGLHWWRPDWLDRFKDEAATPLPAGRRDRLTRRLYADALQGPLQELLRYGDRNSMAWSRELREPFLDHRLAEFVFALPPEHKIHRGETKVLMREAFRGLVPPRILARQDKLGYQAPLVTWLRGPLRSWAAGKLAAVEDTFAGRMIPGAADRFLASAPRLDEASAWPLFSLLTLGECAEQMRLATGRLAAVGG